MFGRCKLAGLAGILLLTNVSCSNSVRFNRQESESYERTQVQSPPRTIDFTSIFTAEIASLKKTREELDKARKRKDLGLSYEAEKDYLARQIAILDSFPDRVRIIKENDPQTEISKDFIPDAWKRQVEYLRD
jgi:hypothetical protein